MWRSDEPLSTIEELDPEPPQRRDGRLWEVVLGLILLLGVLGFAFWQWYHQNQQQAEYAAGVDAVQRNDWDAAQGHFAGASGYLDAGKQAQNAAEKIEERNLNYQIAVSSASSGDWAAALKSVQRVERIETGYKDSEAIKAEAGKQVAHEAISNTVALRPDATPPGLYYYGGSGWAWLPGSDTSSKIRVDGTGGWIVYDVPGQVAPVAPVAPVVPAPTPEPGQPTGFQWDGRHFAAVRLPDLSHVWPLAFDPVQYYPISVSDSGVWVIGNGGGTFPDPSPVRVSSASIAPGRVFAYQSYTDTTTTTISIPPAEQGKAVIMSFDTNSNRYLETTWSDLGPNSAPISDTLTNLYLVRPGGSKRLLYTMRRGSFISAEFSPDGRYALLSTYLPVPPNTEDQSMLLLDLQGGGRPVTLGNAIAQIDSSLPASRSDGYWLSAAFIGDGPYRGKVLLALFEETHYHIRIFDPAGGKQLVDMRVPSNDKISWYLYPGSNDLNLVGGQTITSTGTSALKFVTLSPVISSTLTTLPIDKNSYVPYSTLLGDYLVYNVRGFGGADAKESLLSVPIDHLGSKSETPLTLMTTPANNSDNYFYGAYSFSPDFFGYISPDSKLHARLYDGSLDLVLEDHIGYIYDPSPRFTSQTVLR